MEKITAVEWLIEELKMYCEVPYVYLKVVVDTAKKKEKQQIVDAYEEGDFNGAKRVYYNGRSNDKSGEEYYNETYNQQDT